MSLAGAPNATAPVATGFDAGALTDAAVDAAARHLHTLRCGGRAGARLEPPLRPRSPDDGWRIQRAVDALLGTPVAGWKCALPAADRWVVAALHHAHPSGAQVHAPAGPAGGGRIEPELAFELRHDLPPRAQPYSAAEVTAAIGRVRLAVEVLGCRYADAAPASGPELMADALWHQSLVLGAEVHGLPTEPDFSLTLNIEGRSATTLAARHPDADPRRPLLWLAEFLRTQGVGLQAGQAVITGSLAGVIELPFGRKAVLHFGGWGDIALTLEPL